MAVHEVAVKSVRALLTEDTDGITVDVEIGLDPAGALQFHSSLDAQQADELKSLLGINGPISLPKARKPRRLKSVTPIEAAE